MVDIHHRSLLSAMNISGNYLASLSSAFFDFDLYGLKYYTDKGFLQLDSVEAIPGNMLIQMYQKPFAYIHSFEATVKDASTIGLRKTLIFLIFYCLYAPYCLVHQYG